MKGRLPWSFRVALTLAVLLAALPVLGQSQEADCTRRTVLVRIEDIEGAQAQAITAADFNAELDKKPIRVLSAAPDTRPRRIVILLDASGSMKERWRWSLWLAEGLVKYELPATQLALLEFSTETLHTVGFSAGPGAVLQRLQQLAANPRYPAGATALYDAMSDALQLLGQPTSADVLYVIGDGDDNVSRKSIEAVRRLIGAAGTPLFVALVFDPERRDKRGGKKALIKMGQLTSLTGGEMLDPFSEGVPKKGDKLTRFADRMNAFHRRMITGELLQIELPEPVKKARDWKLELAGRDEQAMKKIRIVYPAQLFPCTP